VCGITGHWIPRVPELAREDVLRPMMRTLHHRGPDGEGVHLDPDRGLAMGHVRLSIIGLDAGHQPIEHPDRVLTVNGEFYDYKRIRAGLAALGERFTTRSDSEIALPLHRREGLDFVHHLRGEFAFALFDRAAERLILVRDRFGIKPLYVARAEGGIVWGSEVKAILRHPAVEARPCRKAALHQMMQVMVPGTTAFEGVEGVLPGHMLVIERGGDGGLRVESRRWWDFEFPRAEDHDPDPDPETYIARTRDLLVDSIATRLEADVPVGCYLSGGIDSCAILGLASPMQQSPVKAFTIAFDHDDYDESRIAIEMAESAGADQEILRIGAADLYGDSFESTVRHAERTFYNTLAVAKWHMSRRVRACGFKVVITGEGSDELFGGYPFFKRDLLLHAGDDGADALQKALDTSNAVFRGAILAEVRQSHPAWDALCGFTPSWIQPWMLVLEAARPLLSDATADLLGDYDPIAAVAAAIDPAQVRGRHPLDIAQYTWSRTMLEGQILTWGGDRVDMANSMESRPAFLDHHLAEFATRIPPSLRIRNGVEKWVLREAARGVLPEVLHTREKFAFMAPPSHTDPEKRAGLRGLADRWMNDDAIERLGIFDVDRVRALLDRDPAELDPVESRRADILTNHLVQLHMLTPLVAGEPDPVAAGAS